MINFLFKSSIIRLGLGMTLVVVLIGANIYLETKYPSYYPSIVKNFFFGDTQKLEAKVNPTVLPTPTVVNEGNLLGANDTNVSPTLYKPKPSNTPYPTVSGNTGVGNTNTTNTNNNGSSNGGSNQGGTNTGSNTNSGNPTSTPVPTATIGPSQTPTSSPTTVPVSPGFSVQPGSLDITIGSRSRIENAFQVSYAGADSFQMSFSLWHGGFVFDPTSSSLSPGQTVNISLQTYGAPSGVTNGTATFKNPVNGATIDVPIHITVN